jgi:hypothetical protein
MAMASGIASDVGMGGGGFGAAAAHDIQAGAYNSKHGIDPGANRARIGHNALAAAPFGFW